MQAGPDIDGAVRPLCRRLVLSEAMRMMRGVYRRQRLTVPTLVVFGRRDHPWTEEMMGRHLPAHRGEMGVDGCLRHRAGDGPLGKVPAQ